MVQEEVIVINHHNTKKLILITNYMSSFSHIVELFLYREEFSQGCESELKEQMNKIVYKSKDYLNTFYSKETKTRKKWNYLGRLLIIQTISYKNYFCYIDVN